MGNAPDTFQQVPLEVAESYEAVFVPALFAPLAPLLLDVADVLPGQRVLDVACGTGIVARTAAAVVGPAGRVVGVDLNESMLTVARAVAPDIEFHRSDAAALPFADGSFDVALCQSGLMFMPDVVAALSEMRRVVAPRGRVAVQVWSGLARQTGFRPLADAVARHAGPDAADLVGTYFRLGDTGGLTASCTRAGLRVLEIRTLPITVRAPSIDDYVTAEVESTPLIARLDAATYRRIREDARAGLAPFRDENGSLALPFEVCLVSARPS